MVKNEFIVLRNKKMQQYCNKIVAPSNITPQY